MKVKVTQPILDYDGTKITEGPEGKKTELTYRQVFINALNSPSRDETFTSEQLEKSYEVSRKLFTGKEVDLTTSQAAYIMERVQKVYSPSPLICGLTKDLLDDPGKDAKTE